MSTRSIDSMEADLDFNQQGQREWDEAEMTNPSSLQGSAAEFIACVGPELGRRFVLQLS